MHATITLAVRLILETRLTNRPVCRNERRQRVLCAHRSCLRGLRIHGWSTATVRRERMTSLTAVEIETRSQSVPDRINLFKRRLTVQEQCHLVCGEPRHRIARTGAGAN